MTKNKDSTRYVSSQQEQHVAKVLEGRVSPNSGAAKFCKSDVTVDSASLSIECKTCMTEKESFSIKKEWFSKHKDESFMTRKANSCLCFNFGPDSNNYYIIDEKLMKFLVEKLKQEQS